MNIFFTEKNVSSNKEAIQIAGQKLLDNQCVIKGFIEACIKREDPFPTGLELPSGQAVSMPHGESQFVLQDSISIVRTPDPVIFHRMDDPGQEIQCQLIFNLALSSGNKHIQVLRQLMRLFQDEVFINHCLQYTEEQIIHYMHQQIDVNDHE
ncbi:PTS sugar transporter subunit IIA [Floccifex sp.]|uniref:PTS sugar transporter subunit IIA n=1 Tax=Floccifex sp. TaxID=2815810 RepID=UPI003EFC00F1